MCNGIEMGSIMSQWLSSGLKNSILFQVTQISLKSEKKKLGTQKVYKRNA
jgi:hypothetical protein